MSEAHAGLHARGDALLARARAGDEAAFADLAGRFRRELQVHCYRIVGSLHDAEDIVQETLLAAWRGLEGFEGRASMRTWLYAIATNRSLNALRARERRIPEPPSPPEDPPPPPGPTRELEPIWLEPYPDELLGGVLERAEEPDARYAAREAIGLAFVAGLQRLPPRQRAVLVLRDVLGFRAAEAAQMLEVSVAAANGALRRARAALREDLAGLRHGDQPLPGTEAERTTVARFVDAFEDGDAALGDCTRLRADGADPPWKPDRGDHRLSRHQRLSSFRPAQDAPGLGGMAFDEGLAERVRVVLATRSDVAERRMFGGLTFIVSGRMCCGVQGDELILRLGPDGAARALESAHVRPMDLTGRPMRGFVTVKADGLAGERLRRWVERAAAYATAAEGG